MNGYMDGGKNVTVFDIPKIIGTTEVEPIQEKQLEYLNKIIQFTKMSDVNLILIKTPMAQIKDNSISLTEQNQKKLNYINQVADDNAIQFINYNLLYDELQLDFKTAMRDIGHLNNYGAAKLSRHLAAVLAAKYELPDHRNDSAYAEWNTWAERVMEKVAGK
jgi:lysophospholipase L1-like esterase